MIVPPVLFSKLWFTVHGGAHSVGAVVDRGAESQDRVEGTKLFQSSGLQ